jgi:hypothetical protein
MTRLEQLCIQYLESCIGLRNVLVALQNAVKLKLDFVRVSEFFCHSIPTGLESLIHLSICLDVVDMEILLVS